MKMRPPHRELMSDKTQVKCPLQDQALNSNLLLIELCQGCLAIIVQVFNSVFSNYLDHS